MTERKQVIREYYENHLKQEGYIIDGFHYFMPDKRIGKVELLVSGDWGEYGCEADFYSVEIERINTTYPQNVIEAFDRHIWFSQHSFNSVS